MSGASARLARSAALPTMADERDSFPVRLAVFAALAAFGVGHWWGLVVDGPAGRAVVLVAIATTGAGALGLLSRLRLPGPVAVALGSLIGLAVLVAGLAAAGLQLRLLAPAGWSELADGIDRGLGGVRTVDWPYDGPDQWVRLTILLGAPLLLATAAVLAFWPARRGGRASRAGALVVLLLLYGVAVTNHDPGSPLTRGFVLLLLVGAWLWLPHLRQRDAQAAAAVTLAVGVLSLPVASALDGNRPWWDYRSFDWFGGGKTVVYDWNHSYGPLDWPRDGTTLLNIKSSKALYWKAEALDRFDGIRWLRETGYRGKVPAYLPPRFQPDGRRWSYFEYNPRWDERLRVTVRSLRSAFVIGPGAVYEVSGAGSTASSDDGTTVTLDEPLKKGESYMVAAYVPRPSASQMRGAPTGYPPDIGRYTTLELPGAGEVVMPPRGDPTTGSARAEGAVLRSSYADVYRLARRLTAGAPTSYDAVARVQRYLRGRFTYDESPPRRRVPLAAFLLRDRVGYCQQFSGAMALMLRMIGIPSRVAAGFSPGSYNTDTKEYRVRDLDAHSWVEVFVNGIGWVTFDPTPPVAPAEAQASGLGELGGGSERPAEVRSPSEESAGSERGSDAPGAPGGDGGGASLLLIAVLLGLPALGAGGWFGARLVAGRRPITPGERVEAQLRELEAALRRLGWRLPGGSTLLAVERRLARVAGPDAASYAAGLRAHRYEPRTPAAPDRAARRALRRALAAAAGRSGRVRALLAIPPGGPFRRL